MVAMTIPRLVSHMVACPVRCVIVGLVGPVVSGGRGGDSSSNTRLRRW